MKSTWPTRLYSTLFTLGVCVGGNANFSVRLGVAQILAFLDIPNAILSHWGYCPTRWPNASVFALQWNIGFRVGG